MTKHGLISSMTRPTSVVALAACLLSVWTVRISGAGASLTKIPVKVTLLNQSGDRILSDGKGAYTNGVDKVTAFILKNTKDPNDPINGKLDVITGQSVSPDKRKIMLALDYGDLVLGTECDPDDTKIEVPDFNCDGVVNLPIVELVWSRFQTLGGLNLLTMPAGTTASTGFIIKFSDGCRPWFIAFQNDGTEWEHSCGPECSALVTVTAENAVSGKGVNASGVDRWKISAEITALDGTPQNEARTCLWSGVTGINSTAVFREIVRFPFHIQVDLQ